MVKPLFSFVVPVYGTESLLRCCLDSIVCQTVGDFEVVVVDDCSPGNCREIVAQYDSRFRYVRHDKNRSLLQARWTGAREARGEYLIAVDSDDYVAEGLLDALCAEIEQIEACDVIVYQTSIDANGRLSDAWHNHRVMRCSCKDALRELFEGRMFWTMWGKAIRRSVYLSAIEDLGITGDFYVNSTEDLCQMLPTLLRGDRLSFIEYSGYRYRQNPASMTKRIDTLARVLPIARQSKKSITVVLDSLERKGCEPSLMQSVRGLLDPTVRWLLEETHGATDYAWSRIIDELCRIYGPRDVMRVGLARFSDFLQRYHPDPLLFAKGVPRKISTVAVQCQNWCGGGAERANWLWMRKISDSGRKVVWFYDDCCSSDVQSARLPPGITAVPLPTGDAARRAVELDRGLRRFDVDAIVLLDHWRPLTFQDLIIAKCAGCKTIVAEHSSYFFPLDDVNPTLYCQRANVYPLADMITVLSPENVAWWAAAGIDQTVYMPNLLTFDPNLVCSEDAQRGKAPHEFLFVGRICIRKNAYAVLEAFKLFREAHPEYADSKLNILGRYEGDRDREIVESAIRQWRLEGSVTIAGEVSDVASYYRRTTALLVASRLEGAPMVIMEAKSYGVPTVMFELPYVVGTSEKEGVVSVRHGDTRAMADAMYGLVSDPDRYRALSRAARDSLSEYGEKSILARWDRVFEMLESGQAPVDHLCEGVDSGRMLKMTMQGLGLIAPVLAGWWRDQVNRAWNASRLLDECRAERDAARKEHAAVSAELERCRQIGLGSRNSELYWIAEAERLRHSRAYRIGRAVTWPYRMIRATYGSLRSDGAKATAGRILRKMCNLKRRFFPPTA